MGAMFQPSKFDRVYPLSYLFTYFVTVPHSILTQLAFPAANFKYGACFCLQLVCLELQLPSCQQ